ncbi:MAG: lipoyl(octanoyl) transferase LipB [Actinobacteria bacterium]|nr:lipoyl(octanoyl) transferase LipB [Actinomycetota bacterium]
MTSVASVVTTTLTIERLVIERLGLIPYQEAWDLQRVIQSEVIAGTSVNKILILEHPSVYTAGRRTEISERPTDGTPVIDVDRGGKITWHGAGQIVGYPILKLRRRNDVVGYVRELETALISALAEFGLDAVRYCERSGVWFRDQTGDRKIAAIGIRVAKGVTMHGFSLNVDPDMSAFDRIDPCGFKDTGVTSMSLELGRKIEISEVLPTLERHLTQALERICE